MPINSLLDFVLRYLRRILPRQPLNGNVLWSLSMNILKLSLSILLRLRILRKSFESVVNILIRSSMLVLYESIVYSALILVLIANLHIQWQ
jgi:hypothetical protein